MAVVFSGIGFQPVGSVESGHGNQFGQVAFAHRTPAGRAGRSAHGLGRSGAGLCLSDDLLAVGAVRIVDWVAVPQPAYLAGAGGGSWNFGPDPASFRTVAETADLAAAMWGAPAAWESAGGEHPHEAGLLTLDARRARGELGWHDRLDFDAAVSWTVDWAKRVGAGESARDVTVAQIEAFEGRGSA